MEFSRNRIAQARILRSEGAKGHLIWKTLVMSAACTLLTPGALLVDLRKSEASDEFLADRHFPSTATNVHCSNGSLLK
jgi:hypothetical protein